MFKMKINNFKKLLSNIRRSLKKGFSLTEVMIWVGVVGIFASVIAVSSVKLFNTANINACKQEINVYSAALLEYYQDTGAFPSEDEGLKILLDKGYVEAKDMKDLKDPWNNDYFYNLTNDGSDFIIKSYGSDKQEGGDGVKKDIVHTSGVNSEIENEDTETKE